MASLDRDETYASGLGLHEWESKWASVEEDLEGDPDAALSQLAELLQQMLVANGYEVQDPVARQGGELEIVASYLSAREVAERAEVGTASRGEVDQAIDDLRDVFRALTAASAAGELE